MNVARLGILTSLLFLSGCTFLVGDHPFSSLPKSSGKLDKTPEVLVLRGQNPQVCRADQKPFTLYYFIHLRWMPFQKIWVEDEKGGEVELFGKDFTIKVKVRSQAGKWIWYETKFRTEEQGYQVTTLVMDCPAPAGSSWSSSDTVSGFAEAAVGS